jgi:hypothetical protein
MKNKVIFLKGNTIIHGGRKFVYGIHEIPPPLLEYFEKIKLIKIVKDGKKESNNEKAKSKSSKASKKVQSENE